METLTNFIFLGSQITADSDCSHEIKRSFAPWKKSYDQHRQCIKKQRHHFANRGPYSQSYGFSCDHVQMWDFDHKEGGALNWFFWTVVLEKVFESSLICKRSNQSNLKEINPEFSMQGLMLKIQCFGHLMQRADSLEKTLMLGKTEERRKCQQRMRWFGGIIDSMNISLSKLQ